MAATTNKRESPTWKTITQHPATIWTAETNPNNILQPLLGLEGLRFISEVDYSDFQRIKMKRKTQSQRVLDNGRVM